MNQLLTRLGVKRTLLVVLAAAAIISATLTGALLGRSTLAALREEVHRRAQAEAKLVAREIASPMTAELDSEVVAALASSYRDPDLVYVVVVRPDFGYVASDVKPGVAVEPETLRKRHLERRDTGFVEGRDILGVTVPIEVPVAGGMNRTVGYVLAGLSTARNAATAASIIAWLAVEVLVGGVVLALLAFFAISRLVLKPLEQMGQVARRVSDGDLQARSDKLGDDELGVLAEAINRIGESLNETLTRVQNVTGGVATVIDRISRTGSAVSSGAGTVSSEAVKTSTSMGEMIASLKGIADNVEVLAQSAEESSSSILEMAATNDEVAENIQALAASVEETTAAIEEMTYSIKEVAKNIEDLSATTEETSSSMNEMDVSISQVETNANETAKLSEQAQRDAEMGAEALSRTLAGIDKIKESSKEAANVIEALGKKTAAIGNILNVIDDVAEQTNLLALNAAILAAQSGEHGKGFAVVADEIKDLAERTGASTKEISDLIRAVQESSRSAVSAMDRGVRNVEEGVRLGQETETALKKIQESSQKSTQMVKAIARATIEQARGSKQVTMAINRIAETVQQIASATAEQARGSEQIMKSAEKMKAITKHVERSAQEQARGSKQITRAIESISEMVHHLNRAQKEQTKGSEQVMTAVVQIKQVAEAQTHSVRDLEAAIVDLASQAEILRGEVRRFRVS
ncbi:MAG: HAMP domain-containing methyl-accepting chemotaxis protein [Anaeromyxobacteraceae bacterium]